jgi:hypothetical protein
VLRPGGSGEEAILGITAGSAAGHECGEAGSGGGPLPRNWQTGRSRFPRGKICLRREGGERGAPSHPSLEERRESIVDLPAP